MILNAILCVWNEEDIIESTIKHLFAQGCSNVYIIDNASTDQTVNVAVTSGAKLAAVFSTKYFNEEQKVSHLNAVVNHINEQTLDEYIWWLYVDADEFPSIQCWRIIDYLQAISSDIDALHGYLFNHHPTHLPHFIQGYHPADFQPLAIKTSTSKVPLIRYKKGKKHIFSIGGAHECVTHGEPLLVIKDILYIHHFPYRNIEQTLLRSKIIAEKRNKLIKRFQKKLGLSDTTGYEKRYATLMNIYMENKDLALKTKSLCYDFKSLARWYTTHEYPTSGISYCDKRISSALYHFFKEEYDNALFAFNDAFEVCKESEIKLWLKIKIAECFARSEISTAQNILSALENSNNPEICSYMDRHFEYLLNKPIIHQHTLENVEYYQTIFPDDVEKIQNKRMEQVKKNILLT